METTIRISPEIKSQLDKMKLIKRESYNNIIGLFIEDTLELNKKTKREIEEARKRINKGEFFTQEEVKKRLGI